MSSRFYDLLPATCQSGRAILSGSQTVTISVAPLYRAPTIEGAVHVRLRMTGSAAHIGNSLIVSWALTGEKDNNGVEIASDPVAVAYIPPGDYTRERSEDLVIVAALRAPTVLEVARGQEVLDAQ